MRKPESDTNRKSVSNNMRIRRRHQLIGAIGAGTLAGLLAVAFRLALHEIEHLRALLIDKIIHSNFSSLSCSIVVSIIVMIVLAVAWATRKVAPSAAGSGIPHLKGVLMGLRSLQPIRLILVKFIGGCLAIGAGLSLGREGPTVQMGGAIGHALGGYLEKIGGGRTLLVAIGAGAGLSAAFNAPLAGFLFVIEELHFELAPLPYISAFAASITADLVARAVLGQLPNFLVFSHPIPPLFQLPAFITLGVVSGILGLAFKWGLIKGLRVGDHYPLLGKWGFPTLAGVAAGVAVMTVPEIAGGGHLTSEGILNGHLLAEKSKIVIVGLLAGKFILTLLSYFARVPGGIFAPMLLIGGFLGYIVGDVFRDIFPEMATNPTTFAVVGMASFFSGVVHAPLTGVTLIIEMTSNFKLTFPMMIASLAAFMVSEWFGGAPVYEALLNEDLRRSGPPPILFHEPISLHLQVEEDSEIAGKALGQIGFPEGVLVVRVNRLGHRFVPSGHTVIQAGDNLELMISGEVSFVATEILEMGKSRADFRAQRNDQMEQQH